MPHDFHEIVFPQKKYYILERNHFISLFGVRKFYEVSPIVGIVTFTLSSAALYFTLYYPWTRTDVAYTTQIGFRNMPIEKPRQCKFIDFADYRTYIPNRELIEATMLMNCAEWERFCTCKKTHIDIEYFNQRQLPYNESSCYQKERKHF